MKAESYQDKYAEYADLFDEQKNYLEECNFLEKCFKKFSKIKVNSILDLGCGTGNHASHLSNKGYDVTGLDISGSMIKMANSKQIQNANFVIGNLADFNLKEKFDSVISMFAAIGYINNNKDLKNAVNCVREHLKPGGLFIFDCWNGIGVMHDFPTSRTREVEKNNLKIIRKSYPYMDFMGHICTVEFDINIIKDDKIVESFKEKHNVRFFFPQEIKKYLEDENFEVLAITKQFDINEKANKNFWMSVIARLKP